MKRPKIVIARVLKLGTLISTFGFIGSIIIQIYARFFLESAPSWTEEASRFFFVYAVSFAAGLAMKDNYYVYLDLLYDRLKESHKKILDLIISASTLLLFLILALYSIQLIVLGVPEKSPSLGVSMSLAFAGIFIMALSVCIYAFFNFLKNLKRFL